MYESEDIIKNFTPIATKYVLDNLKYREEYLKITEEYISSKNIIIGGISGILLLLNKEFTFSDYNYILYSNTPLDHAKELADKIYNETKNPLIEVNTTIENLEYSIIINAEVFIKVCLDDKIELFNLINPIKVKGKFSNKKVAVLSPIIQLINVYHTLQNNDLIDQWKDFYQYENELYQFMISDKENIFIFGGNENEYDIYDIDVIKTKYSYATSKVGGLDSSLNLKTQCIDIINKLFIGTDIFIYQNIYMTNKNFDAIFNMIKKSISFVDLKMTIHDLHLLNDKYTSKAIIYLMAGSGAIPLVSFYNNGTFELIPHTNLIGSYFVQLRILLIELWLLIFIFNLGKIHESSFKTHYADKLNLIIEIHKKMEMEKIENLFLLSEPFGVYINPAKLRKSKLKMVYGQSYYPYKKSTI
jgi:hypothetical protein